MASILTDNLLSPMRGLALGLSIAGAPGGGPSEGRSLAAHRQDHGARDRMSVVRDASSQDYRVLRLGHRILKGS